MATFVVAPGQVSSVFGNYLKAKVTCNSPGNTGEGLDMLVGVLTAARDTLFWGSVFLTETPLETAIEASNWHPPDPPFHRWQRGGPSPDEDPAVDVDVLLNFGRPFATRNDPPLGSVFA